MRPSILIALLKSMRPKQWTKNVFILAAIVFDRQLTHLPALEKTIIGIILFCMVSSAIYLINDLADIEADRQHPRKKFRPIPSGQLPIPIAIAATVFFLAIVFVGSFFLSINFFYTVLIYFFLNLFYSFYLKHIPLVDVLVLASFYVLRVIAGVAIINVERFSPWLYVCTTLLALYIGFGKRRTEISLLAGSVGTTRKVLEGYSIPFLDQLITIVSSTTVVSYSLYTFSAPNLPENHTMMLTIPFVIYAIFRYLYLIQVKQEKGTPDELILSDRPLQAAFFLWGLSVFVIFYLLH